MTVISGSGGLGGTTQTIALNPDLNLVRFQWENFSIPDEFQVLHQGQRIAGDVGLQSGGRSGTKVVTANNSSDQLTVKVTAPLQGTAWNFTVEVIPFELTIDGQLGDVIKVDLPQLLAAAGVSLADADLTPDGFGVQSTSNNRGALAQIDDFQTELQNGVFYFVPTVTGTALDYNANRNDDGLGESTITVTNNGHQFSVKFRVADGFSTTGDNVVTFATQKLDVYRQQQRLAYLAFPGSTGGPLVVDGTAGNNTEWAKKVFSVATDPAAIRPSVPNSGTQYFRDNINHVNAPVWNRIDSIANVTIVSANQRYFGINTTGQLLTDAQSAAGVALTSTGSANSRGTAPPSTSHDAGRGLDIDNIPDSYLFRIVGYQGVPGGFVRAPGPAGSIVVQDGNTYRVGNVSVAADRAQGLRTGTLAGSATADLANQLDGLGLLVYTEAEADVRNLLEAFTGAGATSALYNDPRFLGEVINGITIRFFRGHFNHMHFNVANPITAAAPAQGAQGTPALFGSSIIDLGRLGANRSVSGSLDATNTEQVYRFEIGDVESSDAERVFFDTPRDLTVLLDNLTANADLQLLEDLNDNGLFDADEVLFDSVTTGTAAETINALQMPTGVYYVRVLGQGGSTNYNLSLSLAALPVPVDNAGNTLATAANLGTLSGTVNRSDFLGEVDPDDFYRFQFSVVSDLNLTLAGLSQGDVSIAVGRDANLDGVLDPGELIRVSDAEGEGDESLNLTRLPAGDYVLQVSRISGNSNYQLQLFGAASEIPADQAGDTLATAFNLGALSGPLSRSDFVGGIDPIDLYRFSVTTLTGLSIDLSNLAADADLQLLRDTNSNGVLEATEVLSRSKRSGTSPEQLTLTGLLPGEYFLRIAQYEGDTTYDLSLTPQAASGADLAVTRSGTNSAVLGGQYSYTVQVTNTGPDTATNVSLTETLPSGLQRLSVSRSNPTSTVTFTTNGFIGRIASLAPGASISFTVSVRSFIAGKLTTVSEVTAATSDFNLANNRLQTITPIGTITSPPADLELTQTVSNANPRIADQITLTLSLFNRGPGTATVIRVRDILPVGLAFRSFSADLGSYNSTTGVWTVGNMPPNVTVRLRITADVVSGTALVNTAELIAVDERDPDSTPNNNNPAEDDQTSVTITVFNPNTPPTVTAPAAVTAFEDVDKAIGISVGDIESSSASLTLSVGQGTLTLGSVAGLTISGNGSGSISLSGTITDLNVALATLLYRGSLNFSGTDTLDITVSDGSLSTSRSVAITVDSAAQQAGDLQSRVNALRDAGVLNQGQANSLNVKLNLQNNNGDIGKVESFLHHVSAFLNAGILTQAQADDLLSWGNTLLLSVTRR